MAAEGVNGKHKVSRILIGIGHKRRVGKDTVGKMLRRCFESRHMEVRRTSFAWAIKEGLGKTVLGLNDDQLYGDLKVSPDPFWQETPRSLLQRMGLALREGFNEDVWVRSLEQRIVHEPWAHFIVTDVRYLNEAEMIRRLGGFLVEVRRLGIPYDPAQDDHISETELDGFDGWDYSILNSGDFIDLEEAVRVVFDGVCATRRQLV